MMASKRSTSRAESQAKGRPRKSVEDVSDPRENKEPVPRRETSQDTENPPNENLDKDPDEAYGDTEIPGTQRRR